MPGELLSTRELAGTVGESEATVSFWARSGLLDFSRRNGRARVFPAAENVARIRFIRAQQRRPEVCSLRELRAQILQGKHRPRRQSRS
jgi:DNA-binding transcriptional MerR regulator